MAESNEFSVAEIVSDRVASLGSSAFNGSSFQKIYRFGSDVTGSDEVTELARDLVSASGRDYVFECVQSTASQSVYLLFICDDLSFSNNVFTGGDYTIYRFDVRCQLYTPTTNYSGSITIGGDSGTFRYTNPNTQFTLNITPSVQSSGGGFTLNTVDGQFYYSSVTDLNLIPKVSEVNILACIAFILAVLGCSLWFAAIFRNVQRR